MNDRWVIVADGAHARFMALEQNAGAPPRAEYQLVESARLSNPEHTVSGRRDDVRKIKSGRDTGRGALAPHGYTDHRGPHEMEVLRRFASRIAVQAATLAAKGKTSSMILVANPHMLGLLRAEFEQVAKKGVKVQELARDYTWCTAPQLYRHLVSNGLLPHG